MRSFRHNVIAAIVSLLLLAGYGSNVFDFCCGRAEATAVAVEGHHANGEAPADSDGCQCLCHQIFMAHSVGPVRVSPASLTLADRVALVDEIPPDSIPRGIDYPPQLT